MRRALSDLVSSPELCYLQWYARADEYKVLLAADLNEKEETHGKTLKAAKVEILRSG